MSCHGEIQTTLYPGDIIIVNTNIWFHSTKVLSLDRWNWMMMTWAIDYLLKIILLSGWTTTYHLQKMSKQSGIQKIKREYYGHWGTAGYFLCNSFCKLVADVWCRFCSSGTRTRAECQHGEWVWLGWANPIFCGFIDVVCALIKVHCSQTWFTCSLNDLNYCAFDLILNVHLYTNFWTLALAL